MSFEDTAEVRQNNEFEALQAIYGNDLKDLRSKSVWNKWVPLHLSLTLTPQQGSVGTQEFFVKVDLHVICDDKYPNSIPKLCLNESKGLSITLLQELQKDLEQRAKEHVGEEMIFQLSQYVQEFLHRHNKPTSKSFYDEMLQRQKEQQEKYQLAQQIEQDRQRKDMLEEVQKRQEILRSEVKKRRELRQSSENTDEETDMNKRKANYTLTENSTESLCQHKGTCVIIFGSREIQRGKCIRHSNHVTFSAMDKGSGELFMLNEWVFNINDKAELSQVLRTINSIEQEMNYLTKLKHPNLIHYYGLKHYTEDSLLVVNLLKEFIYGTNCFSLFLVQNINLDVEFLKYIAKEVLIALDYLHRNNVVHKKISSTNIYLSNSGVVRLSNYGIHKRLSDLTNAGHNYSKKTDIFKYGIFLLSLVEGRSISEDCVEIPNTINSDLYDMLTRCLAKDETDRFTTSQLLHHSFFHKPIIHFSPKHNEAIELDRHLSPEIVQNELHILSQPVTNGQSRLDSEFEFLQHLGKGAFGDVIKVRNKLDGGCYAIKRIQLNPKNKALNKKIIREVKLLSRLNHENVVRYYNSWIETTTIKEDYEVTTQQLDKIPKVIRNKEFTINDNVEALAPPIKNVEVSITYDSKSQPAFDSSSDESSSDEDEAWGTIYHSNSESDDGIEFQHSSKSVSETTSISTVNNTSSLETVEETTKQIDFMYIQMEFCEKSTLRIAIDNNLYLDVDRVWRLFREIVEGLAHIHQQGMIHRDLKPVNIFLDSEDHVKIGDFGLATTSIKSKQNENTFSKSAIESEKEDTVDESKTGQVGTALYVAPEINSLNKVVYTQKVDIYSLGIILFEMCYKPLETSMERIKILTKLRLREIQFPKDFMIKDNEKQRHLIKWLLEHDISKRPTSQELLQSEYVPPPVIEECELRELVRHTLSNPQLKGYKYLIASCFKQPVTPAQDVTYDKDLSVQNMGKPLMLQNFVKQKCIKIFKQHGGQNISTPLLMPKSKFYEGVDSYVKLMTHFGGIVSLPHDLRVPFARYIAWNGINLLRRYSIERVYREKKVFGFQPRELCECAFDIVTPTQGSLMTDAEILYIVYEIINEFDALKDKHFLIRLNHTSLIKGILLHCGIKDDHQEIYRLLSAVKEGKSPKSQLQNHFIGLGLSDYTINLLLNMFNSEFEVSKAMNQFQMITKKKYGEASQLTRQALQELKIISHNAEAYGVKFDILISPGLFYNIQQYSGMICQFVCELKKKHKHNNMEVLAAGGRYDSMVSYYQTMMEQANMATRGIKQYAVGISISIDKLVQALQKEQTKDFQRLGLVDVIVCSVGDNQMTKERNKILKSLWAAGIKSFLMEVPNMEDIQDQLDSEANHLIILKDNEQGMVRVRSWDKDRFLEKCYTLNDLLENLQRIFKSTDYLENIPLSILSRSESKASYNNIEHTETTVDIIFVTTDKISSNAKKRYENQIRSQLDGLFKKLTGFVTVVGLQLESNIIRSLASFLEFETEYQYQKSVDFVIERHQRHRKYLTDVCDEIFEQKSNKKNPSVVLYSLSDYFFKVII